MARDNALRRDPFVVLLLLSVAIALFAVGCKKSEADNGGEATIVALGRRELNADGTITSAGLQTIEAKAGSAVRFEIRFMRAPLKDAGLIQLAKFPSIRVVEAYGSPITAAGIEKLKKAIPEVEVRH